MVLTEQQVSVMFGWLLDKLGGVDAAGMKLGQSAPNLSKMRNPECGRQPPALLVAKASALTRDYALLDALNAMAGREDETARLRKGMRGMRAEIDDLLEGEGDG